MRSPARTAETTALELSREEMDAAAPFATIALGFALSALWAVVVVAGFFMLGRARWWLLLGLPTALFHPAAFILLGAACTLDTGQCP